MSRVPTASLLRPAFAAVAALSILALTGCAAAAPAADEASAPPAASPEATPTSADASTAHSAEDAFRTWLAASREPDTTVACAYLNEALTERMLSEMRASGFPVTDCADMIATTADIYRATGATADVDIDVLEESSAGTLLFVRYAAGSCGRVELVPSGADWIITENSEEEC